MTYTRPQAFLTLITVFFFWGFVAASNDILIPVFKDKLHLEHWQSQMVSFAFYVAYTVGSLIYFLVNKRIGGDLLNKLGYKNGIALGLFISAIGTLFFYPAAEMESFGLFITGLFIVGLGFSLQQTAANPLAIVIGPKETGSQRLSLAGGINNLGTTLGPLLVSFAIVGTVIAGQRSVATLDGIKAPYLILGAAFILVALMFKFSSVPDRIEGTTTAGTSHKDLFDSALKYPQLVLGMAAIFIYVGVEVTTASNLPEYLKQKMGMNTENVAPYVSLFWASMMIGRWTSAAGAFGMSTGMRQIFRVIMPYLAFGVFLGVNKLASHDITPFYVYGFVILTMILGDFLSKGRPALQLLILSIFGGLATLIGMLTDGMFSAFAFISVGLYCSTMWPCIFTLAIRGLGSHTNEGSAYLIMMIMGGGFISLFQGWLASDHLLGIKYSYAVGIACFIYLAYYAVRTSKILRDQGVDAETI